MIFNNLDPHYQNSFNKLENRIQKTIAVEALKHLILANIYAFKLGKGLIMLDRPLPNIQPIYISFDEFCTLFAKELIKDGLIFDDTLLEMIKDLSTQNTL